jgi:hypothetical protein
MSVESERGWPVLRFFVVAEETKRAREVTYSLLQNVNDDNVRIKPDGNNRHEVIALDHNEKYRMKFILCDNSNLGLYFTTDDAGPIWIEAGRDSPKGGSLPPDFDVVKWNDPDNDDAQSGAIGQRRRLVVRNRNRSREVYKFTLLIKDQSGARHDFDPIIENGGGQRDPMDPGDPKEPDTP